MERHGERGRRDGKDRKGAPSDEAGAARKARGRSAGEGNGLELETFLPYRLNLLNETVSRSLSRIYSDRYSLGVPEWRVLVTLGQYREMTAKQVGAHSQMHKTKISRAAAALQEKGLLAREIVKNDRRTAVLTLTARGRQIYEELVPAALEFCRELEAGLSAGELKTLDQLLRRLMARAGEISEKTG